MTTNKQAKFCMYVTPANRHHLPGYLSPNLDTHIGSISVGPVVQPSRMLAIQFDSIAAVNACIERHGWKISTSVKPGWTTAYAAEWY